jgi:sulfite reductase (NADPH) flavoprotein alpha-component
MTASPAASLFTENQWQEIQRLIQTLDSHQALWLSGYLAGRNPVPQTAANTVSAPGKILIAFGSETGNSKALAQQLHNLARAQGVETEVTDLATTRLRQLSKYQHLLLICSTHGDGDPPEPIANFYQNLMDTRAPQLPQLSYAVLALGDSSYEHFCATGRQIDERLASLGATRLLPCQDCDVDYTVPAKEWMEAVLKCLPSSSTTSAGSLVDSPTDSPAATSPPSAISYSKQQTLTAQVLENICLSAGDRPAPIHHLELAVEAEDFIVTPGDAVGVLVSNPPALVAAILHAAHLPGEQTVTVKERSMPLMQALSEECDLTIPSKRFLEMWAKLSDSNELLTLLTADSKIQRDFLRTHQLRDLISQFPASPDAQIFVEHLRPLQPRLYDVANSRNLLDDELHLTVKQYRYPFKDRYETGIASDYLLQAQPGDELRIYPHRNTRFQLPEDTRVPLILVADGTGIAPYRSFLQEIKASERSHLCWLVFAEQRFEDDFLYQLEWQQAQDEGLLERVDTLFYGDEPDRTLASVLIEQQEALSAWLQNGAHLYFCGDKDKLTDCDNTLQSWAERQAAEHVSWQILNDTARIHRNLY